MPAVAVTPNTTNFGNVYGDPSGQPVAPAPPAPLDPRVIQAQGQLGSLATDPSGLGRSAVRYDQTSAERLAQQQNNFTIGGGGPDALADAARNAGAAQAQTLQQMGGAYYNQMGVGAQNMGTGIGGMYDTAGALNQYAQQGPGPSVAQAQLQANTAQAMRQQLAMAGSGRGAGGGAAAYRNAAAQQAMIQGGANAQAAALQAQEAQNWRQAQLQAMGQAGSLYGQGAGIGAGYAQGMAQEAGQSTQASGQMTQAGEAMAEDVYKADLAARAQYEQNLTNIYGIDKGVPQQPDDGNGLMKGLFTIGGGAVGAYFGGPAGAVAGAQLGNWAGSQF